MKRGSWILKMVLFGVIAVGLIGFITQMLWNWLVPMLFTGPQISFWQALGLLLLSKILLFPLSKRSHSHYRKGYWRPYWKEKWSKMTEEEKLQFRQKMKDKCGWGTPVESQKSDAEK